MTTLLTTAKMQAVQSLILDRPVEDFEDVTFSVHCPSCRERIWGFDNIPESGLAHCPACNTTLRFNEGGVSLYR